MADGGALIQPETSFLLRSLWFDLQEALLPIPDVRTVVGVSGSFERDGDRKITAETRVQHDFRVDSVRLHGPPHLQLRSIQFGDLLAWSCDPMRFGSLLDQDIPLSGHQIEAGLSIWVSVEQEPVDEAPTLVTHEVPTFYVVFFGRKPVYGRFRKR